MSATTAKKESPRKTGFAMAVLTVSLALQPAFPAELPSRNESRAHVASVLVHQGYDSLLGLTVNSVDGNGVELSTLFKTRKLAYDERARIDSATTIYFKSDNPLLGTARLFIVKSENIPGSY